MKLETSNTMSWLFAVVNHPPSICIYIYICIHMYMIYTYITFPYIYYYIFWLFCVIAVFHGFAYHTGWKHFWSWSKEIGIQPVGKSFKNSVNLFSLDHTSSKFFPSCKSSRLNFYFSCFFYKFHLQLKTKTEWPEMAYSYLRVKE